MAWVELMKMMRWRKMSSVMDPVGVVADHVVADESDVELLLPALHPDFPIQRQVRLPHSHLHPMVLHGEQWIWMVVRHRDIHWFVVHAAVLRMMKDELQHHYLHPCPFHCSSYSCSYCLHHHQSPT